MTKKPFRQIKTDIKNSGKNKLKREKLEISLNKENYKKDNLTPNKYLKRMPRSTPKLFLAHPSLKNLFL